MEYRQLGDSGLQVSPICLGAMMFGSASDDKSVARIIDSARKRGINFIDTADGYSCGNSEKILGKLLKKDRKQWVLATKIGSRRGPAKFDTRLGKRHMMLGIDESLTRLQTDWIDIWYLHKEDHETAQAGNLGMGACFPPTGPDRVLSAWTSAQAAIAASSGAALAAG